MLRQEVLRQVWRITERKSESVMQAEFVEEVWVSVAEANRLHPNDDPDLLWIAPVTLRNTRMSTDKDDERG
jgi:hypothetical protein